MNEGKEIKAPGKAFRAGISLIELFETFPDNGTGEAWFAEQRWPDGKPTCPHCGHDDVQVGAAHASQRYRCRHRECGRRFSVKIGTVMEDSNIKFAEMGHRHLPDRHVAQGRVQHEAAPRREDHTKERLAYGAPHPRRLERRHGRPV